METPHNQAAAEGLPAISRRSFLRSTAGATALGGVAMMATPSLAASEAALDELLLVFIEEQRRGRNLTAQHAAAYKSMPRWARSGPKYLMGDGSLSKDTVGWPEIETLPEPSGDAIIMRLIRPSVADVWRYATAMVGPRQAAMLRSDGSVEIRPPNEVQLTYRRNARLKGFKAVRKVIARVRQQREEERKVGLDQINLMMEATWDRLTEIEGRIRAISTGCSPTDLAADALMESRFAGLVEYTLDDQSEAEQWVRTVLLARLLPHLTGVLREVVDDFVNGDGSRLYAETLIGGGERPARLRSA